MRSRRGHSAAAPVGTGEGRCPASAAARKPWRVAASAAQRSPRHGVSHLTSLRRRCMLGALLLGLCLTTLLGSASGSSPSSPLQHQPPSRERGPHHIRDLHEDPAAPSPERLLFGTALYVRSDVLAASGSEILAAGTERWWFYLAGSVACVTLAALAAGLTIGLVSIDPFDLALIQATEEADCSSIEEIEELRKEKAYADQLMPLVQKHHLLLVTLLICNACANELLPLLLDKIVPSYMAVLLSVTFVLVFGEILPSAIFTGPDQLRLASSLTPVVWSMLAVCWILAYPIACLLDRLLGVEDDSRLRRSELKSLIRLQAQTLSPSPTQQVEGGADGGLSTDEVKIMHGALELKGKCIRDAYVPIDEVYMLSLDAVLDIDKLAEMVHQGHSRIPVFDGDRHNVRGVLLVKRLIVINPEDKRLLRSISCRWPLICSPDLGLLPLLDLFQQGRSHMAIVCDNPSRMLAALRAEEPVPDDCNVLGIITLEDVLELLIKEDIQDETDEGVHVVMQQSEIIRRRIKMLKLLADAQRAGATPSRTPLLRGRRSNSISRVVADVAATRLAALSIASPQMGASPARTPAVAEAAVAAAAHFGYQAEDAAAMDEQLQRGLQLDITSPGGHATALPATAAAAASASPPLSQRAGGGRLSDAARLPRDNDFTRPSRAMSTRNLADLAAFVPPPSSSGPAPAPAHSVASAISAAAGAVPAAHAPAAAAAGPAAAGTGAAAPHPFHHQRSMSLLTPRALISADGMVRRDLDNAKIRALQRMGSTVAANMQQTHAHPSAAAAVSPMSSASSNAPTRQASMRELADAADDLEAGAPLLPKE